MKYRNVAKLPINTRECGGMLGKGKNIMPKNAKIRQKDT